nr:histidine kinase [uncultured Carboxylicivirga sp.]
MHKIYMLLILIVQTCIVFSQSITKEQRQRFIQHTDTLPLDSSFLFLQKKLQNKDIGQQDSALLFNLLGNNRNEFGANNEAVNYYRKALLLYKKSDDFTGEVKVRLNLSRTYSDSYNFTQAGNELFLAKQIATQNKDTLLQLKVKEYFSNLFYVQGEIDSTLFYLRSVVSEYEKRKDTTSMSRIYNNLGVIYKRQELFHKAIFYNKKALELSIIHGNRSDISDAYNNLGVCYENLYNKTDNANYLQQAITYYEQASMLKHNQPDEVNTALMNLANLNRTLGNDSIADKYFEKLESITQKTNSKNALDLYRDQMFHSINTGDITDAAFYFALYDSVLYEIHKVQEKDFANMLTNQYKLYAAREKDQEQQLIIKEEQNKRLQIEKKQFITQVVFFVFAIIVTAMFYYLRQRKKYLSLRAEKENKSLQDAVLRTQMNPHFIFNALTAIQNSILKEDQLVTASYVSRFARLIRQSFDFANVQTISIDEDISALTDYIETQKMRFGDKFSYEINIDNSLKTMDIQIPPMMLQPLVENSIQHGFKQYYKQGFIVIGINKIEDNKIGFAVTDNGVGFDHEKQSKKDHALDVLKKRLALFNDNNHLSFIISTPPAGGTKVYFELSLTAHV